jgi:hypothetical protein
MSEVRRHGRAQFTSGVRRSGLPGRPIDRVSPVDGGEAYRSNRREAIPGTSSDRPGAALALHAESAAMGVGHALIDRFAEHVVNQAQQRVEGS